MIDRPNPCFLSTDLLLIIMEYLDVKDLCRCAQVSWTWDYINRSLDNSTWKRIFLRDFSGVLHFRSAFIYFEKFTEIKNELINEDYLMNTFARQTDEKTWKDLYRNHFIWKRLWKIRSEEVLAKIQYGKGEFRDPVKAINVLKAHGRSMKKNGRICIVIISFGNACGK